MKKQTYYSLALLVFCFLNSCNPNYSSILNGLREELTKSGDTIHAYSIQHHYAIWIHEDSTDVDTSIDEYGFREYGNQSLYYYDLETKEKKMLFETKKDSLLCKRGKVEWHITLSGIKKVNLSQDGLALLIVEDGMEDGDNNYFYPLSKKGTLYPYESTEDSFYISYDYENMGFYEYFGDNTRFYSITEIHYNTNGEEVWKSDTTTIHKDDSDGVMGTIILKIPTILLQEKNRIKRSIIYSQTLTINDLYSKANNEILFREEFASDKLRYFKLDVTTIRELPDLNDRGNSIRYRVDGDNFSFYTKDRIFVSLSYPSTIIISAKKVSDVRSARESIFGGFLTILGGNLNADFIFSDVVPIEYELINDTYND